jgi:hypothetical protein
MEAPSFRPAHHGCVSHGGGSKNIGGRPEQRSHDYANLSQLRSGVLPTPAWNPTLSIARPLTASEAGEQGGEVRLDPDL